MLSTCLGRYAIYRSWFSNLLYLKDVKEYNTIFILVTLNQKIKKDLNKACQHNLHEIVVGMIEGKNLLDFTIIMFTE